MSEEQDKPNEQLDGMLRRWGVEEAAQQADVAHLAAPVPSRRRGVAPAWRWAALAASLTLLVGAVAVLMEPSATSSYEAGLRPSMSPPVGRQQERIIALEQELAETEAALAEAEGKLSEQGDALAAATARKQAETDALAADLAKSRAEAESLAASLEQERARPAGDATAEALAKKQAEVEALRAELVRLQSKQNDTSSQLTAQLRETEGRATALEAQQELRFAMFQKAYLAAAAPGETGLRARQIAARENRLLERCGQLRGGVSDVEAQKLFDTLEVLLTRLDMLDTADDQEAAAFGRLVEPLGLRPRIDDVLRKAGEAPAVREWLAEAELVFSGV